MRKIKRFRYSYRNFRYVVQIKDEFGVYFCTASETSGRLTGNWCWFNNQKRGL